jgi:menaquinol-cytochrome c reductase iron-sulfur subunit
MEKSQCEHCNSPDRRGFLKKLAANVLGAIITIVPLTAGLAVWLDPARRKTKAGGQLVRVAALSALPEDGVPRKFTVLASRVDAWNKSPEAAIGAVYLRRIRGEKKPRAFNVVCPHAGCFVDFMESKSNFLCPCHNSTFALDGKINDPKSPSPRGLDELEVEVRNNSEVWVKFQNFRAGVADKIPA